MPLESSQAPSETLERSSASDNKKKPQTALRQNNGGELPKTEHDTACSRDITKLSLQVSGSQ